MNCNHIYIMYLYLDLYESHNRVLKNNFSEEVLSSAHPKTRIFILGRHFTKVLSLSLIKLFMKQSCILDRLPGSTE